MSLPGTLPTGMAPFPSNTAQALLLSPPANNTEMIEKVMGIYVQAVCMYLKNDFQAATKLITEVQSSPNLPEHVNTFLKDIAQKFMKGEAFNPPAFPRNPETALIQASQKLPQARTAEIDAIEVPAGLALARLTPPVPKLRDEPKEPKSDKEKLTTNDRSTESIPLPVLPKAVSDLPAIFKQQKERLLHLKAMLEKQSKTLDNLTKPESEKSKEQVKVSLKRKEVPTSAQIEPDFSNPQIHSKESVEKAEKPYKSTDMGGLAVLAQASAGKEVVKSNPFLDAVVKVHAKSKDLVKLSEKYGINSQNSNGDGVLHLGMTSGKDGRGKGKHTVLKNLLSLGASPNLQNKHGDTPMHVAARHGLASMLIDMIKKGGDKDIQNNAKERPLDLATSRATKHILMSSDLSAIVAKRAKRNIAAQNETDQPQATAKARKSIKKAKSEKEEKGTSTKKRVLSKSIDDVEADKNYSEVLESSGESDESRSKSSGEEEASSNDSTASAVGNLHSAKKSKKDDKSSKDGKSSE